MEQKERIRELIDLLNKANEAYYAKDEEIMSNFEYDALYDELVKLEEETGIRFSDSPTVKVGYEAVDSLPKERHDRPMLSLSKTKSVDELAAFLNGKEGLLSWKLDGLTVVLTYEGGKLSKAVTRGNGEIGEVITGNASTFINIPLGISFTGKLVLRGEAVISYPDFEKINASIEDDMKYKNPRNLCSGSVRQLNSEITARRRVRLVAFNLVSAENREFALKEEEFAFLKEMGFEVVEYIKVTPDSMADAVGRFAARIADYEIPSDGLVLSFNDIGYGKSLGMTAKFPRDSIAFKWQDETAETTLKEIEWSPSRTGLINPVAIFDTVELEGTSVSRASVHNISVMEELKLGLGDRIRVYKANMIIPQIAENITKSGNIPIPGTCPCCGAKTEVRTVKEAKALYCTNPGCPAKKIKKFEHFVSRDALNVEGLSEATLERFVDLGFIKSFEDIFRLEEHRASIVNMEGFGERSYANLMASIDKAKKTTLPRFIYALGIPGVGLANAKLIVRHFKGDPEALIRATGEELSAIDGIGEVIGNSVSSFFMQSENLEMVRRLQALLSFEKEELPAAEGLLSGKTVVVTGSLNMYDNRKDLQNEIEKRGGKVSGSVSKNTFVLVNNDINSGSSKNKTAKELGIPIITEEEFVRRYINAD